MKILSKPIPKIVLFSATKVGASILIFLVFTYESGDKKIQEFLILIFRDFFSGLASHLRGLTQLVHPAGVKHLSLQSTGSKINNIL
jgi:hypothetical protein